MPAGRQSGFDPLYIISNGHSKKGTVAKNSCYIKEFASWKIGHKFEWNPRIQELGYKQYLISSHTKIWYWIIILE